MKSSYSIVCIKKHKTDKEGYLFLRNKGKTDRTKKAIGFSVDVIQFNKHFDKTKNAFKSTLKNYQTFNDKIDDALKELQKTNNVLIPKSKDKNSFLTFWELKLKEIGNHNSRIKQAGIKTKFEKYLKSIDKSDVFFSQLTPDFIKDLQKYLKTAKDPNLIKSNTVTHYLKVIKGVIKLKIEDEPTLYVIPPFTGIKFDKKTETERPVLQEIEIDRLLNAEIDNPKIDLNRDKFLFQIFAQGMRVSDLLLLRWSNIITGLAIAEGTEIPAGPKGVNLKPILKYKMFKTDAIVETPITFNICMILLKLISMEWRAYEILEGPLYLVKDHDFIKDLIKGKEATTFAEIEEAAKYIKKPSNELADFIENAKRQNTESLVEDTMYRLTEYIWNNGCLNDFVFPHLKNEFFKDVVTSPDSGFQRKITVEQNQKLLNGETLYNRQLKQVAEETGLFTNLISHGGRHTFAQLMINEGAPTHEIMEALRHKNLATTGEYLRHKNFRNTGTDHVSNIGNKLKYRKA